MSGTPTSPGGCRKKMFHVKPKVIPIGTPSGGSRPHALICTTQSGMQFLHGLSYNILCKNCNAILA